MRQTNKLIGTEGTMKPLHGYANTFRAAQGSYLGQKIYMSFESASSLQG